ncbi:MAG: vitamin K epoxide reductase family protein, partial [Candidatus Tectomicrobia bacterium]|nr:vitamin K epoxide reductase family protein [Candidatus Tectomicrobia bacterium]
MNENRWPLQGILVLALAGVGVSSYLSYLDVQISRAPNKAFCSISQLFSCDVVIRSPYAHFFGIPVAYLGVAGFLLFLILAVWALACRDRSTTRWPILGLVSLSWIALVFECYLTSVEAFVLKTFCPYCLTVFAFIIAIFLLSLRATSRVPST